MSQPRKRKISTSSAITIQHKKPRTDDIDFSMQIPVTTGGDGKRFMHGTGYQKKMTLITFLTGVTKQAVDKFCFASEMAEAEKFDDFVYIREDPNTHEKYYSFYQAKHYQDENVYLDYNKLLIKETKEKKEKKGNFVLLKYFKSFRTIESRFNNYKLEKFVICSNIMMSEKSKNDLKEHDIELKKIGKDDFFDNENFIRYKLSINFSSRNEELFKQLRRGMDFNWLAEELVSHIINKEKLKLSTFIFSLYHIQLIENEILTKPMNSTVFITNTFLNKKKKKNKTVKEFFQIFKQEYEKEKNRDLQKYKNTNSLPISHAFGKKFNLNELEKQLVKDQTKCKAFADELLEIMSNKNEKNVFTFDRRIYGKKKLEGFIESLAGRVLFYFKNEETVKFGLDFLNQNNNPKDEFYLLKTQLKEKLGEVKFDNLRHCKINISKYYACFEDIKPEKVFVNENDESKIERFFNNLILLKTPNNEELDKELDCQMCITHKLSDASLVTGYMYRFISAWMEERKGTYLTNADAQNLITETKQKLRVSEFFGITDENCTYLKNFNVSFQSTDETMTKVEKFLLSTESRYLFLQTNYGLFGALKVQQVVNGMEKFTNYTDSFLFLKTSSIQTPRQQKRIKQAFGLTSPVKLLVVVTEDNQDNIDTTFLSSLLLYIIETEKKVILINCDQKEITKSGDFPNDKKTEMVEDETKIMDLDDTSIKYLLKKIVRLQGKKIKIKKLIENNYEIIDSKRLVRLVKQINSSSDLIEIGKKITSNNEIYFQRKFSHNKVFEIGILRNIENDDNLFIVEKDNSHNVVEIISSSNGKVISSSEFHEKSLSQYNNKHFFKQRSKELIWQKSYGTKNLLMKYEKKGDDEIDEEQLLENLLKEEQTMIIADLPGMGKTTTINNLIKSINKIYTKMWIIRIKLGSHRNTLEKINDNLFEEMIKGEFRSSFDKKLFHQQFLTNNKCAIIVDGYDEVQQEHRHKVDKMLKYLCSQTILVVTTRTKYRSHLEELLDTFSYSFIPFKEQKQFLTNFWEVKRNKSFTDEEIFLANKYAEAVLKKFKNPFDESWKNYKENTFVGVPQQLVMLGEILKKSDEPDEWDGIDDYLINKSAKPRLPGKFKVYKFYDLYVTKKVETFARKNYTDAPISHDEQKTSYQLLALKALLNEENLNKVLDQDELQTLSEIMKREKDEGNGIIDNIDPERNEINFVHLTYAEFFAAQYLVSNMQFNPEGSLFCINSILENASKVFGFCVNFKLEKSKKYLKKTFKIISLLNYTVKKNFERCFKKFMPERYNFPTPDINSTPLHYAAKNGNIKIVVHMLSYIYGMLLSMKFSYDQSMFYLCKYIDKRDEKRNKSAVEYAEDHTNVHRLFQNIKSLSSTKIYPDAATILSNIFDNAVYDQKLLINGYSNLLPEIFKKETNFLKKVIDDIEWPIFDVEFVEKLALDEQISRNDKIEKICYLIDEDIIFGPSNISPLEEVIEYGICEDNLTIIKCFESDNYIKHFKIACEDGSLSAVKHYINKHKLNLCGSHGSPLHFLIKNGIEDDGMTDLCIKNGIDINFKDDCGNTALHVALDHGYFHTNKSKIISLLEQGSKVNSQNKKGETPLFNIINEYFYDIDIIKLLVENDYDVADLSLQNHEGKTALDVAMAKEKEDVVKYLLSHYTRDQISHLSNYLKNVYLYYNNPINYDLNATKGNTSILNEAIENNDEQLSKFLIQKGANVNNNNPTSPLKNAIEKDNLNIVKCLLQAGAKMDNKKYKMPHKNRCRIFVNEIIDLFKLLDTNEARVTSHVKSKIKKIIKEYDISSYIIVGIIIKHDLLRYAVKICNFELFQFFIENGAIYNNQDTINLVTSKKKEEFNEIWNRIDDLFQKVENKQSITNADVTGIINARKKILHGAKYPYKVVETLLHCAARVGNEEVVKFLINNGFDIMAQDNFGRTAVKIAQEYDHKKMEGDLKMITWRQEKGCKKLEI